MFMNLCFHTFVHASFFTVVCSCSFVYTCLFMLVCSNLFVHAHLFTLVCSCSVVHTRLFMLVCFHLFVSTCLFTHVCLGKPSKKKFGESWDIVPTGRGGILNLHTSVSTEKITCSQWLRTHNKVKKYF